MHHGEILIDEGLVAGLIADHFPKWTGLPVSRNVSDGTVNAVYRLGDRLCVRLPLLKRYEAALVREVEWLPRLAGGLTLEVPEPVAIGEPSDEYPCRWAVLTWVEGSNPTPGQIHEPRAWANVLAGFIRELRDLDTSGGPTDSYRGRPLIERDVLTRKSIDAVADEFDPSALLSVWESALEAPEPNGPARWFHGDLHSTNLIERNGRLVGVIDFGGVSVGEPSSDLIAGWWLFDHNDRQNFRDAMGASSSEWARGRGWALSIALVALPYYRQTSPRFANRARYAISQVLADQR